jgi:hypothetical protein
MGARKMSMADRQRWDEAERRVWSNFRAKLQGVGTWIGAVELALSSVPPDTPGRCYYMNLNVFLSAFVIPERSSYAEKALYLELIRRVDATGILKPGAREQVEKALREAMEKHYECPD